MSFNPFTAADTLKRLLAQSEANREKNKWVVYLAIHCRVAGRLVFVQAGCHEVHESPAPCLLRRPKAATRRVGLPPAGRPLPTSTATVRRSWAWVTVEACATSQVGFMLVTGECT